MRKRAADPLAGTSSASDASSGVVPRTIPGLPRSVLGIRGRTLILSFPGSPKACDELFGVVEPVLDHALKLLRSDPTEHL